MEAEFSEFTYGYAAIREAEAGLETIYRSKGAPLLPSLIDEKSKGWDVRLAYVDFALFLQFKRSTFVSRRHPGSPSWDEAGTRHYRYGIDTDGDQHQALLTLESSLAGTGDGYVFYSAPNFHRQVQLDSAYLGGSVLANSSMILPSQFGTFVGRHHFIKAPGITKILSDARDAETVSWGALQGAANEGAVRASRREARPRITVGDLEDRLQASVARLERQGGVNRGASALASLHGAAALLGCGLAIVTLDPRQM